MGKYRISKLPVAKSDEKSSFHDWTSEIEPAPLFPCGQYFLADWLADGLLMHVLRNVHQAMNE